MSTGSQQPMGSGIFILPKFRLTEHKYNHNNLLAL